MSTWNDGYVQTNGIRMHYWRTGKAGAPQVVLSHGGSDSGRCWVRVAGALEDRYDLIMVDARGHGLSDKPDNDYGPTQSAADLAGLIRDLHLDRPHLLGHSMGGQISATCAAEYPELPRSLVIVDSMFISNTRRSADPTAVVHTAEEMERQARETQALGKEGLMALGRKQSPTWHEDEFEPWAESKLQAAPMVRSFFSAPARPWQETIAAIRCPILLLVGEPHLHSHTGWDAAVQATGIWQEGQLIHVAGAGHNVQREQFETFVARVSQWLATH
jgi:N-formylmaleamate deformylase